MAKAALIMAALASRPPLKKARKKPQQRWKLARVQEWRGDCAGGSIVPAGFGGDEAGVLGLRRGFQSLECFNQNEDRNGSPMLSSARSALFQPRGKQPSRAGRLSLGA